jgi:hypothetical protein
MSSDNFFALWVYLAATPLAGLTITLVAYVFGYAIYTRAKLLPREAFLAPSRQRAAVMIVVERPFEAVDDVVDLAESRFLERDASVERAMATAADEHYGAIHACDFLHLTDEVRIDLPVRSVVPRDVMRANGMADEVILHLAAAVDEHGRRMLVQERRCFGGLQMFHIGKSIMC